VEERKVKEKIIVKQVPVVVQEEDANEDDEEQEDSLSPPPLIPETMENLFAGMARVNRDAFAKKFDVGVPLDETKPGNEDVLILYSNEHALPDQYEKNA